MSLNSAISSQKDKEEKNKKTGIIEKLNNYLLRFSRVPLKEKLFFIQYFGIMFKTGISLSVILQTLSQQTTNKRFAGVIKNIGKEVEKGSSLADAFRPHTNIFGELFINMIEAGEVSGNLENVLNQLYIQTKKQHELTSKVKGALTYPTVLVVVMILIGIFMMIVVVPKLLGVLSTFGTTLPLPTRIMIAISDFINENGLFLLALILLLVVIFVKVIKTHKGKYYFDLFLLKIPVVGTIIKKINLARFARTASSLIKTDILIVRAFKITASILGSLPYREAVGEVSEKLEKGGQINEIISTYPDLFPPVVRQIVAVGEETGELDEIFLELADFYEKEVDNIMNNLPSIIEPLLIVLLGIGVGGMAVAVIMPMYSLTSTI